MIDFVIGLAIGIPLGYFGRGILGWRRARRYLHSPAGQRFLGHIAHDLPELDEELRRRLDEEPEP